MAGLPLTDIDAQPISYDESTDRYIGWTTDGGIAVIDGDGTPRYTRHLADRLPGYKRLYDTGNSRPPNVMVVPRGEQMALVLLQGGEVGHIWYYDLGLDVGQLTTRVSWLIRKEPCAWINRLSRSRAWVRRGACRSRVRAGPWIPGVRRG